MTVNSPTDTADSGTSDESAVKRTGGEKRAYTKEMHETMVAYFRRYPGDINGAAVAAGVTPPTARRTWQGPVRAQYPWALPVKEVLQAEESERLRKQAEEQAALRLRIDEQKAKAAELQEQNKGFDEKILSMARADVLVGLKSLGTMSAGIQALANRTNKYLAEGTDANGQPLNIPVAAVLTIMSKFANTTRALADAAASLVAIERVKANLPTAIVALEAASVTPETAAEQVAIAVAAMERAKKFLGLPPAKMETAEVMRQEINAPQGEGEEDEYG